MSSKEICNTEEELVLRKEKTRMKMQFTIYRNRLLRSTEEQSLPISEVNSVCSKLESFTESTMEVMSQLSELYIRNQQTDKGVEMVNEMERLEEEFHYAYKIYWESHTSRKYMDDSGVTSVNQAHRKYSSRDTKSGSFRRKDNSTEQIIKQETHAPDCSSYSIGEDLWKQLERIQLPVFTGEKRAYQNWKAAFMACVDNAPATGEYKLLQLRQCLSGDALQAIENLGHSATAYEAAKDRLERRYGGRRRQVAIYLEDLDKFQQIRSGNARDLEHFADLLELAIINLTETGHHNELGNGFLYGKLQTKLTESMLADYHRWIFETKTPESVLALKTWVFQESTFQTIASETVHGLSAISDYACTQSTEVSPIWNDQITFFGELIDVDSNRMQNTSCQLCGQSHKIWTCQIFVDKNVPRRWDTAKRFKLCFRCLGDGHVGKTCQNSLPCGQNGCQKLHHVLLHIEGNRQLKPTHCLLDGLTDTCTQSRHNTFATMHFDSYSVSMHQGSTSGTEGKNKTNDSTTSPRQAQDRFNISDLLTQRSRESKEDSIARKLGRTTNGVALLEHRSWSKDIPVDRGRKYGPNIRGETENRLTMK